MKKFILVFIILGSAFSMIGCKRTEYGSVKRYWEIKIDGDDTDWPDSCIKYLEKPGQAVCFANDENYFYLLLRLSDPRTIMQVVGQGAIIWLEPKGKSKLGIRYPVGLSKNFKNEEPNSRKQKEEGQGDFRRGFFNNREVSVDGNLIKQAQKEMEIFIPEKDLKRLVQSVISKSYGIEAKFAYNRDRFIYEIKLPLNKIPEYEFALDTETTDKINIDIESEVPNMKSGPLGGSGSSGFEGMAEGGPLGRGVSDEMPSDGYGMPTDARARMEKIEMKLLVKLAR